jgi:KaiC/GvpD/RAD55 family RecA-like ATPase
MDDLEKFAEYIFGEQTGYVYSPVKRPDSWEEQYFSWPEQKRELYDWIRTSSIEVGSDVYLSPSVYREKRANKGAWKSSQMVWVEFDGKESIDFRNVPRPDIIVQSSSDTHVHCYWKIGPSNLETVEDINTRLTYYLEADSSGVDATQLLRPPTSINWKHTLPVSLVHFEVKENDKASFDSAPKVANKYTEVIEETEIVDGRKLLIQLPLPPELTKRIKTETPEGPKDGQPGFRSQFLFKIAHDLAEEGCSQVQIVSLLAFVDERVGKYTGRSDRVLRLSQIAALALHRVKSEDALVVYTLQDVIDHTDDLEWILPGWLHSTGILILSGAPGVGKTQMAMDMGEKLVMGKPFLDKQSASPTKHKILMISLEMDIRELKYVVNHHKQELDKDFDWSRFLLIDESSTRLSYEELIEEHQPTVVIIDSLSELFDDEMGNVEAKATMRWLRKVRRKYGCAMILIHHNRKATEGNRKPKKLSDLYGSFSFGKDSETVLSLYEETKGIELSILKARFSAKGAFFVERSANLTWTKKEVKPVVSITTDDVGSPKINLNI